MESNTARRGVLIVSIDVDREELSCDLQSQRSLHSISVALLSVLSRHRVSATWSLCEPAQSLVTERIQGESNRHEIALLGDPSWSGPLAGRARFAAELARRTLAAQARGLSLATLSLRSEELAHSDLLVKWGFAAARHAVAHPRGTRWWRALGKQPSASTAQPIRWGLWQLRSAWQNLDGGLAAGRRNIDRAVALQCPAVWVLDGPALAAGGGAAMRLVDRVLSYAATQCDRGALQFQTVRGFVTRQSLRRASAPAQSILRARAA